MWNYLEYIILQLIVIYLFWFIYFKDIKTISQANKVKMMLFFIIVEVFILRNLMVNKSIIDWIIEYINPPNNKLYILEYLMLQFLLVYLFYIIYFTDRTKLNIGSKIESFLPFVIAEIFILYNLINEKSIIDWIIEHFNQT